MSDRVLRDLEICRETFSKVGSRGLQVPPGDDDSDRCQTRPLSLRDRSGMDELPI